MAPKPFARVTLAALLVLAAALVPACDIRPLTASQLYGAVSDAGPLPDGGAVPDAPPDMGAAADAVTTPEVAADAQAPGDVAGDTGSGGDADPRGCPTACAVDQFCDVLTSSCASRSGAGMLSGVVRDACTGIQVSALVGIGGHHTCSYAGKGSYFLNGLPLGVMELAVAKPGYQLFHVPVTIVPGGVVHDVDLQRLAPDGGTDPCAGPPPAEVACSCTTPTCTP